MAKTKTDLEGMFQRQIAMAGLHNGCEQQARVVDGRRFAWDFCWKFSTGQIKGLLVEIQGSVWVKGGHNTGIGLNRDYTKNNLATIAGYDILFFSGDMVKNGTAIQLLEDYFEARKQQGID